MKRAAGFSLIELVVILLIAGILAAIAIPRLSDSESKATWYHEQVAAAVRFAQRQAVAQRRAVFVCTAAGVVSISYVSGCADATVQPGAVIQIPQALAAPTGVAVAASVTPFSFSALGQPSPIAGVSLTVGGRAITVSAETGYVVAN